MPDPTTLTDFAYVIPLEKYVYKKDGKWAVTEPVGKPGIIAHLVEQGWEMSTIKDTLASLNHQKVYGWEIEPNADDIYTGPDGKTYLNIWVPPAITPQAGEWPRIDRVIGYLTQDDDAAAEWVFHWMALKVQNPAIVPKVAAVFTTKPGGGKGTLAKIMQFMLGRENCDTIENGALENHFNTKWAGKLFVLADEVLTSESHKNVSNRLKVLIDGEYIELEGKGTNQRAIRNRLAWMFASNDDVAPVIVEAGDRRYSVFSNHGEVPEDYKVMLEDMWEDDKATPTESFLAEIRAFYHALTEAAVDRRLVSRPYANRARAELIEASLPGHQQFFHYVDEFGIDDLANRVVLKGDFTLGNTRGDWDFGARGISSSVTYQCYVMYCTEHGNKPLRSNKFVVAARKHGWAYERLGDKRTRCFVIRRNVAQPAVRLRPVDGVAAEVGS